MAKRGRKPNPEGERIVREVVRPLQALPQYDPPLNLNTIAGLLNHFSVPTLTGKGQWSASSLKRLEARYGP